jgi:hypothetical protein
VYSPGKFGVRAGAVLETGANRSVMSLKRDAISFGLGKG